MHTPPSIPYSGLTFVIDEPSRHDIQFNHLISGPARDFINHILPSPYTLDSSDIRDLTTEAPFLPGTKKVILAGAKAAQRYNAIADPPGYLSIVNNCPAVSVFYPQDCCDYRNFRSEEHEDSTAASDRDTKDTIPTLFKNRRFWTSWHIKKFLSSPPLPTPPIDVRAYPALDGQIALLNSISNQNLYLDIETSRFYRSLSCIGWTCDSEFPKVYVVPVYLSSGSLAYKEFHRWHKAFSLALTRNTAVIHNSSFDLTVLHCYYKFCLPHTIYDTMIAQHRCFPEAEKSLGHTISTWTSLPYHKNFNTEVHTFQQEQQLWTYNAKDVYALKLVKPAQENYANTVPGLIPSIIQANNSILPYLTTSFAGLRLDLFQLANTQKKLKAYQTLYAKMASILAGVPFNPGSQKQCADYFHKTLHYQVMSKTPMKQPAMGSKQLYQLLLKYNNPLLPVIIKYREVAKDASSLESELWRMP